MNKQGPKLVTVKIKTIIGYLGDMAASWFTEKDWKDHWKMVEKLKKKGLYGKEVEHEVTFVPYPKFDDVNVKPVVSNKIMMIDLTGKQLKKKA